MTLPASTERRSAFTWRSALFGLLGILLMSGLACAHDSFCPSGPLMVGNHLPGGALTYMLLVGLAWNGLAGRLSRRLALSPRELVVVLCATLVACFPPTSGLMRYLIRVIVLPWYYLPGNPEWTEYGVMDMVRHDLFPVPYPGGDAAIPGSPDYADYQRVYQGLFSGLAQGNRWVALTDLPLRAWIRPLSFWGPLVLTLSLVCIAMQFLVHRQWSRHEQLGYPLAQVTGSLCHRADGRPGVPDIFRGRLFWWGFTPVFLFYFLEFLSAKYPASIPSMREVMPAFKNWSVPINTVLPDVMRAPEGAGWSLGGQSLFFTIVGAAYFVSSEISLTMGFSSFLLVGVAILHYHASGTVISSDEMIGSRAGAFLGYAAILLYTGRSYFRAIFLHAFRPGRGGTLDLEDDGATVLAARVLVLSFAALVWILHIFGLDLAAALLYALLFAVLFLVFTRVICETGIPFLQAWWTPNELLASLLGPSALGPRNILLTSWIKSAIAQDQRECLMPYVATGVKVADDAGLRLRRVFLLVVVAVVAALAVAFLSSAYAEYNVSAMTDSWASAGPPRWPFSDAAHAARDLHDFGEFEAATSGTLLSRLGLVHADPAILRAFLLGGAAVLIFSALRFKFAKFPLHPLLFLVWGTGPACNAWESYLVGWFLKTLVTRFGGGGVYRRFKPLFIGLIVGEIVFVGFHVVFDLVFLAIFHTAPPFSTFVLPG